MDAADLFTCWLFDELSPEVIAAMPDDAVGRWEARVREFLTRRGWCYDPWPDSGGRDLPPGAG